MKAPELKNKVAVEFFVKYDCTRIVGNIDFCVSPKRLDPRQRSLEERGAEEDAYSYDTIGNLQFAAFNATTNIYTANNLNQYTSILRASAPPREISHDDDGNMLSDGALTYAYDSANRLKSVSSNGVMLVTNFYDAKSRRVKKVTPEATHAFFYDGWNLIEERIAFTNGASSTIRFMVKAYNAAGAGPAAVTDGWRYREYAILFYTIDHERVEWDEPSFDR